MIHNTSKCYEVEKLTYVQGFYGNTITNITAVVGDNGCGKSTLLRLLLSTLPYDNSKVSDDVIVLAMRENDALCYYTTALEQYTLDIKEKDVVKNERAMSLYDEHGNFKEAKFEGLKLIYCNNFFDYSDYFYRKYGEVDDLSFGGLISSDYRKGMEMHQIINQSTSDEPEHFEDVISAQKQNASASVGLDRNYAIGNYYNCEILRQLEFKFAYNDLANANNLPFTIPEKIYLKLNPINLSDESFTTIKREVADLSDSGRNGSKLLGDIENLTNKLRCAHSVRTKKDFIVAVAQSLFLNAINDICVPKIVPFDKHRYYDDLLTLVNSVGSTQGLEAIDGLFQSMHSWTRALESQDKGQGALLSPYMNFMDWLFRSSAGLELVVDIRGATVNLNTPESQQAFADFVKLHIKTNSIYRYIDFYWPLSSGEFNLFSLYARFFSILRWDEQCEQYSFKRVGSHGTSFNSAIILIDEADLTFHPKWQQRYIKSLVEFLSQIYNPYEVQIIFTTHSPILLSDIEHSSVIRIAKNVDENGSPKLCIRTSAEKTFAQNIHTLFADSFVLDIKNLGETLGDFSYSKINNCLELLNNALAGDSVILDSELRFIEYVVERIGEPVVSEMLTRKLIEYKKSINTTPTTGKVDAALAAFKNLGREERNAFIKAVVNEMEGG